MHFAFSSAYPIKSHNSDIINSDGPHVIIYRGGDLYSAETHNQWYCNSITKPTDQYLDSNKNPTAQVNWSDDTKPPAPTGSTTPSNLREFELSMDLTYRDREGKSVAVVYVEVSTDSLTHTIHLEDNMISQTCLRLPWTI